MKNSNSDIKKLVEILKRSSQAEVHLMNALFTIMGAVDISKTKKLDDKVYRAFREADDEYERAADIILKRTPKRRKK